MKLRTIEGQSLNQVSKEVLDYIEANRLKPKQIKKWRFLGGTPNLDPVDKLTRPIIYPASYKIPLCDVIIDPENGPIKVGSVKSVNPLSQEAEFNTFVYYSHKGAPIFVLSGDNADEVLANDGLLLSNLNASNPFRDTNVEPIIQLVDEAKEAKLRSAKFSDLELCLKAIREWDNLETKSVAASNFISTAQEPEVLKNILRELAQKDPTSFLKSIDSRDGRVRGTIKLAEEAQIISFNSQEYKYVYSKTGETIAALERREGKMPHEQLTEILLTGEDGSKKLAKIEKELKTK